jgi:hypothetical protein
VTATEQLPTASHCLQSHYLAMAVVWMLILQSLPSNGSTCHIILGAHMIYIYIYIYIYIMKVPYISVTYAMTVMCYFIYIIYISNSSL